MAPIIILLMGIFFIFIARGLWKRRLWSRNTVIILSLLSLIYGVIAISQGIGNGIIAIILNCLIAGYLIWNKRAKEAFS